MTTREDECRPNFFLVGAAKCGTTSVAKYLDQHPEVFVSKPKEPNYFSFENDSKPTCRGPVDSQQLHELLLKYSVTSPTEYLALFSGAQSSRAVGEASVRYLYEASTAVKIAEYAPRAKLIVLLRDPIDRLHSHYHMNVRQHIEPLSLVEALAAEDQRVEQGWGWDWHYRRVGNYAEQLQRYFEYFDRSQVLVLFHAALQQKPLETMQTIFRHLEVAADFTPDFSARSMVGHTPRSRILRSLIRDDNLVKTIARKALPRRLRESVVAWSESKNRRAIPHLAPALRTELANQYAEEAADLTDLLGKSLPW